MEYNFKEIEPKWQRRWQENKPTRSRPTRRGPNSTCSTCSPTVGRRPARRPSAGYIASDIYSRYKRQKGFNVLHPMGYDAFGLPAENAAIKHNIHPSVWTHANIDNMRAS